MGFGAATGVVALLKARAPVSRFKFYWVHRVQRLSSHRASDGSHATVTVAVHAEVDDGGYTHRSYGSPDRHLLFHPVPEARASIRQKSAVRSPIFRTVWCELPGRTSQLKNRNKAMRTLRARIVEAEREKQEAEIAQNRKAQVVTGEQARRFVPTTFRRIGDRSSRRRAVTLHKLEQVLEGISTNSSRL